MAENDSLKNELASQSGATTTTPTATSPTSIATGNTSLDAYNTGREQQIRDVYDKARQNNLAALQTAYDQNMSNAQANRDKITPQYQDSMNQMAAEYERQRRNNNLQAQANGLNTGAGSQMQLGQMNVYNQGQAGMQRQMNEALDTADRGILDLKTNYQNQISQAAANNDYQLAAALLDEFGQQYQRQLDQAQQLAQFGDFSLYTNIYGADAAKNMETSWMLQNPDLAWTLGKISREQYFSMTGKWPHDATGASSGGGSSNAPGYYSWWGRAGGTSPKEGESYGTPVTINNPVTGPTTGRAYTMDEATTAALAGQPTTRGGIVRAAQAKVAAGTATADDKKLADLKGW